MQRILVPEHGAPLSGIARATPGHVTGDAPAVHDADGIDVGAPVGPHHVDHGSVAPQERAGLGVLRITPSDDVPQLIDAQGAAGRAPIQRAQILEHGRGATHRWSVPERVHRSGRGGGVAGHLPSAVHGDGNATVPAGERAQVGHAEQRRDCERGRTKQRQAHQQCGGYDEGRSGCRGGLQPTHKHDLRILHWVPAERTFTPPPARVEHRHLKGARCAPCDTRAPRYACGAARSGSGPSTPMWTENAVRARP